MCQSTAPAWWCKQLRATLKFPNSYHMLAPPWLQRGTREQHTWLSATWAQVGSSGHRKCCIPTCTGQDVGCTWSPTAGRKVGNILGFSCYKYSGSCDISELGFSYRSCKSFILSSLIPLLFHRKAWKWKFKSYSEERISPFLKIQLNSFLKTHWRVLFFFLAWLLFTSYLN